MVEVGGPVLRGGEAMNVARGSGAVAEEEGDTSGSMGAVGKTGLANKRSSSARVGCGAVEEVRGWTGWSCSISDAEARERPLLVM